MARVHPNTITKAAYDACETYFRAHPGDWVGAGKAAGIDRRAAMRAWCGPMWKLGECSMLPPLRDKFAVEDQARRQRQAEQDAALQSDAFHRLEKAKKLAEEAEQMDEATMRVARLDVLGGLRALSKVREGIEKLADRCNAELLSGVDPATGLPVPIDPIRVMRMLREFSHSAKQLTEAATTISNLERTKQNLPTSIIALQAQVDMSIEEVEREVELASFAVQEAKRLGLHVIEGGKQTRG